MSTRSRPKWMRALLAACTLGLAALFVEAQTINADLQKKFDSIVARFEKSQLDFEVSLKEAKDDETYMKLVEKRPGQEFLPEFQAVALEGKGTELAAKALVHVTEIAVDFGVKEDAVKAVDTLVADHVTSPALAPLPDLMSAGLSKFLGKEKAETTLRTLGEKNPHKPVQAGALYSIASTIMREKKASPERAAEARQIMERLQKDYAGVTSGYKQDYGVLAEATLFEMDHLQIGKVAPDFEVVDENGVKFKLSDYRGKVVVIDFWGNW